MKWFVCAGMFLAFISTNVNAETMYVSEIIEITLRTGPGIDHKVIAMVPSGVELTVLESGGEWTRVRLPNEKEGYVLNRFLTNKKPSEMLLRELEQKYQSMETQSESLRNDYNMQKDENQQLLAELSNKEERLAALTESYETLKQESTDFLSLKKNHENTAAQLTELTEKARRYEEALTRIQKRQIFRWVLTGAGILLVGFLIGMSSRRQKRRSSLL
jgi:SH3 domain protein